VTGMPFTEKRLKAVLGEVWESIATGGLKDHKPGEHLGKGRLALSGIVMSGLQVGTTPGDGAQGLPTREAETWRDPQTTPAVRRFPRGSTVGYAFGVYNARREGGQPKLSMHLNLYRDGTRVQSMPASSSLSAPSADLPVAVTSVLRLGRTVPPGSYTLEVVVADQLHRGKKGGAVQWVDFDVVN